MADDLDPPPPIADDDEVSDQAVLELDQFLPANAADALRKVLYRARRGQALILSLETRVNDLTTAVTQLNTARVAQANRITQLEARVTTLEARLPPP
jgi:hypothetical protein